MLGQPLEPSLSSRVHNYQEYPTLHIVAVVTLRTTCKLHSVLLCALLSTYVLILATTNNKFDGVGHDTRRGRMSLGIDLFTC